MNTKQFGIVQFSDDDVFEFPDGIPGFESERKFLCVERPAFRPVVFLQSLVDPDLCFITLPARSIDPAYQLNIAPEELNILGLAGSESLAPEAGLACLAIVCLPPEGQPTANLLGPVILSRETRKGVQSVRDDSRYSAITPLPPSPAEPVAPETGPNAESSVERLTEV